MTRDGAIAAVRPSFDYLNPDVPDRLPVFGVPLVVACLTSAPLGHLSLFLNGGFGSSRFDVKPLVVDGSSGGF